MKQGKRMRKLLSAGLVCTMLAATGIMASAALMKYNTWSKYAGSVGVTAEVGYNGTDAYAQVRSNNGAYLDGTIDGDVYYDGGSVDLFGNFSQRSYYQEERICSKNVTKVIASISVTSDDGSCNFPMLTVE